MKFAILIATYGDQRWQTLALNRALPSADGQGAHEVIQHHEPHGTVASCRNNAAAKATSEWLVFLDADDELAPGYIAALEQGLDARSEQWPCDGCNGQASALCGDCEAAARERQYLLTPAVSYRRGSRTDPPKIWAECDLREGNWLVIGTAIPRTLFLEAGGFVEGEPHGLEDWSLWQRCWKLGAVPVKVPDAVYIAHRNSQSKHHALARDRRAYLTAYHDVRRRNFPELYPEGWTIHDALRPDRRQRVARVRGRR